MSDRDPPNARTPDEMFERCEPAANDVAARLARWQDLPDPHLRTAADSGLASLDEHFPGTADHVHALDDWRPPPEKRRNSVYMDATTIVTTDRLLSGARGWLTPLALWDLSTLADRIVMCDRIYYVGEHLAPADELNRRVGDTVFVSVPPFSPAAPSPQERVYSQALARYRDFAEPIIYGARLPQDSYWADAIGQVTTAWSLLTGQTVRPEQAIVPCDGQRWFTPRVKPLQDPYCDDLPMPANDGCPPTLGDITFRAYASQSFANVLGVPYAPVTPRMPFRHHFCSRSWELDDRLRTGDAASSAYAELAREGDLVLPVFLAVALADATRPEDVWRRLGELRNRASRFRARRVELDTSLERSAASDDSRRLLSAVRSEALQLTDLFGFGYELVTKIVSRLGRATPPHIPEDVATALGIARAELPADVRSRLWWWFFRPELRFLTEVRTQSRQLTDALPQVGRLWGLPPRLADRFRARFENLAALRTQA